MNKDFSLQCLRNSKVYETKQEAIEALNSVQSSDGSIVLARYKDSTGKIKTIIATNCNLDGISDPDLKSANYTIYDPDVVGKVDPNSDGTGEIFNDYENNKATGKYSHVEGYGKCIMNFDINAFLINLFTYGYFITVNNVSQLPLS